MKIPLIKIAAVLLWVGAIHAYAASVTPAALVPPDSGSHRGGKMVGDKLTNPDDLLALGKLFQQSKDLETRQEYFLRLLDYFWFSKKRLIGMKRAEIEKYFGPGVPDDPQAGMGMPLQLKWGGGRDILVIVFEGDVAKQAGYIMGF